MHHLLIADGFWVFMPWLVAVALWWWETRPRIPFEEFEEQAFRSVERERVGVMKWEVYKSPWRVGYWVSRRDWRVTVHETWREAFDYAYRNAVAAIHEVP